MIYHFITKGVISSNNTQSDNLDGDRSAIFLLDSNPMKYIIPIVSAAMVIMDNCLARELMIKQNR